MKRFIAILCCLSVVLALSACGEKDTASSAEKSTKATQNTSVTDSSAAQTDQSQAEITAPENSFASVSDFFEANKESFLLYKEAMGGTGLSLDVKVRGNSLVYSYQYTYEIGDFDLVKETLELGFDQTKESFGITLEAMKKEVPTAESIIIEYLDMNGDLITSCEVTGEE